MKRGGGGHFDLTETDAEAGLLENFLQRFTGKIDAINSGMEIALHFAKVNALKAIAEKC
jgi:hypothetical protein